jgi:hypothetical protein
MKKVVRIKESELVNLIDKIITETTRKQKISEGVRNLTGKQIINEEMVLKEADTSLISGIAKNLYLYLKKMRPNNPLDINGSTLKNIKGEDITHNNKVNMSYQNSSDGMNKMAMQGKAKKLGQNIQGGVDQNNSEVTLNYALDQIYALGFVKKEEAQAALDEILKKYSNQVTGQILTNKMDYNWAKNHAPTYAILIRMKDDKSVARTQSARPQA